MRRVRNVAGLAVAGLWIAMVTPGCGLDCGTGTKSENGECVSESPVCGPGTHVEGGQCVLDETPRDGGGPDIIPDAPPDLTPDVTPDVTPDACPGASMCTGGTVFNAALCSCDPPPNLPTGNQDRTPADKAVLLENAIGASFAPGPDGLYLYWTSVVAGENLMIRRQKIDTATKALQGTSELLSDLGPNALSPSVSLDGRFIIWSCDRRDHGLQGDGTRDLCVASRATPADEFTGVRVMEELQLFGGAGFAVLRSNQQPASGPSFVAMDQTGDPKLIFFSAPNPTEESDFPDVCVAGFNSGTGMGVPLAGSGRSCDDGSGNPIPDQDPAGCNVNATFERCNKVTLTCQIASCIAYQSNVANPCMADQQCPTQQCNIDASSGQGICALPPFIVSEELASETSPAWTADGKHFAWSKVASDSSMFDTEKSDIWVGQSSGQNGFVDTFLGRVGGPNNDLEPSFAPDASGVMVWTEIVDLNDLSAGASINIGTIDLSPPQ